jgi:hypothetical protein
VKAGFKDATLKSARSHSAIAGAQRKPLRQIEVPSLDPAKRLHAHTSQCSKMS